MRPMLVMLCTSLSLVSAQMPVFHGPLPVLADGSPVNVGYYGAPIMYDWDGDSAKDLICGQFSFGYITFYRNIGSDSNPLFHGCETLSASGSSISLPYG